MKSEPDRAAERHWLPDFCATPAALSLAIVAELVMLMVLLAPDDPDRFDLPQLAIGTLFVQWLAALTILALCRLRPRLALRAAASSAAATLGTVFAVVFAASLLAHWIGLAFAITPAPTSYGALGFALSIATIAALVMAAVLRYAYVQAEWQRGVRAQSRAELAELQARIRPHFLFNTLNAIATLVARRPDDAERAIENLSDLLRTALANSEHLVPLAEELQLVERYLEIERLRLGERITIRIDVPDALRNERVPSLSLQPLVENAIIHGIERRPAGGEISLVATQAPDGALALTVRNPLPAAGDVAGERRGMGSAQANVRRRIRYHFGASARLDATAGEGYYSATLWLPPP